MNKVLITVMLLFTLQAANAQTEKGKHNVGIRLGYFHGQTQLPDNMAPFEKSTRNHYSITPNYGYFIANNLEIGAGIGYYYIDHEEIHSSSPNTKGKGHGFNAGITLHKYFLFQNKIGIRTGPYLSYQADYNDEDNNIYLEKRKTVTYRGGIKLDLVYYPTQNIGLAATIGALEYNHQKITGDYRASGDALTLALSNSVNFSVYYVLGK